MYMLDADLRIVPSAWHSGKTHSHIRQLNQLAPFKLFTKTSYSLFFLFSSNNSNICLVNTLHRNSSHFCAFHSVFLLIGAFLIVFDNVVRYLFFCLHVFVFRVAHRNQLTCTILWEIEENGEKTSYNKHLCWFFFRCLHGSLLSLYSCNLVCVCVQTASISLTLNILIPNRCRCFVLSFFIHSLFNFCKVLFSIDASFSIRWHSSAIWFRMSLTFRFFSFYFVRFFFRRRLFFFLTIHFVFPFFFFFLHLISIRNWKWTLFASHRIQTIKVHENCQAEKNGEKKTKTSRNNMLHIRNWNCLFQSKNSNWAKSKARACGWQWVEVFFALRS